MPHRYYSWCLLLRLHSHADPGRLAGSTVWWNKSVRDLPRNRFCPNHVDATSGTYQRGSSDYSPGDRGASFGKSTENIINNPGKNDELCSRMAGTSAIKASYAGISRINHRSGFITCLIHGIFPRSINILVSLSEFTKLHCSRWNINPVHFNIRSSGNQGFPLPVYFPCLESLLTNRQYLFYRRFRELFSHATTLSGANGHHPPRELGSLLSLLQVSLPFSKRINLLLP